MYLSHLIDVMLSILLRQTEGMEKGKLTETSQPKFVVLQKQPDIWCFYSSIFSVFSDHISNKILWNIFSPGWISPQSLFICHVCLTLGAVSWVHSCMSILCCMHKTGHGSPHVVLQVLNKKEGSLSSTCCEEPYWCCPGSVVHHDLRAFSADLLPNSWHQACLVAGTTINQGKELLFLLNFIRFL